MNDEIMGEWYKVTMQRGSTFIGFELLGWLLYIHFISSFDWFSIKEYVIWWSLFIFVFSFFFGSTQIHAYAPNWLSNIRDNLII